MVPFETAHGRHVRHSTRRECLGSRVSANPDVALSYEKRCEVVACSTNVVIHARGILSTIASPGRAVAYDRALDKNKSHWQDDGWFGSVIPVLGLGQGPSCSLRPLRSLARAVTRLVVDLPVAARPSRSSAFPPLTHGTPTTRLTPAGSRAFRSPRVELRRCVSSVRVE